MDYDVVIVGGGTTGCALAARLSEDPGRYVLLLEAGPDFPEFQHLPSILKYGWGLINLEARAVDSPYNWSFVGSANPEQPKPMPVPRGKVMGGTVSKAAIRLVSNCPGRELDVLHTPIYIRQFRSGPI